MNDLVKGYFEKAGYDPKDERKGHLAEAISFLNDRGMLKDLTYQWFVGLMARMEKAVQF